MSRQRSKTVNSLGVNSIRLREMGGALSMRATRAARKMNKPSMASSADTFDLEPDADIPVPVTNARTRRRMMQTKATTARTSLFQRRPATTPSGTPNRRQQRTQLQTERGRQPVQISQDKSEWVKVMTQVDQQKSKLAMLTHRIDGLAQQLQKRGSGDVDGLADDIEELADMVQEHNQTLEELADIADMVRDLDSQVRDLHDASHFFYATTLRQVPCLDEPCFDAADGAGYIAPGETVLLVSPMQQDDSGNIWIRARRINADAQLSEYWVPMAGEDDDDYFEDFRL